MRGFGLLRELVLNRQLLTLRLILWDSRLFWRRIGGRGRSWRGVRPAEILDDLLPSYWRLRRNELVEKITAAVNRVVDFSLLKFVGRSCRIALGVMVRWMDQER